MFDAGETVMSEMDLILDLCTYSLVRQSERNEPSSIGMWHKGDVRVEKRE